VPSPARGHWQEKGRHAAVLVAKDRLQVTIADGQFYWTSRGNRSLQLWSTGEFTDLSSEPGPTSST
jgi:hypothetical protein